MKLFGTASATMTQSVTFAIDGVIKTANAKGRILLKSQSKEEHCSKLLFRTEHLIKE